MNHVPMCSVCGDWEVGKEIGSTEFCSQMCEDHAHAHGYGYGSAGTHKPRYCSISDFFDARVAKKVDMGLTPHKLGYLDLVKDEFFKMHAGTYSEE